MDEGDIDDNEIHKDETGRQVGAPGNLASRLKMPSPEPPTGSIKPSDGIHRSASRA